MFENVEEGSCFIGQVSKVSLHDSTDPTVSKLFGSPVRCVHMFLLYDANFALRRFGIEMRRCLMILRWICFAGCVAERNI